MDTITLAQRFHELIRALQATTTISYKEVLAERLGLLMDASDAEPADELISMNSLESMIRFLERHPRLAYPSVTITPSGDFYATWRKNRTHVFSIEFLNSGQARFVVLKMETAEQLSGLTFPSSVMNVVAPLNVMEWAAYEG
jgi:hypothetical protein